MTGLLPTILENDFTELEPKRLQDGRTYHFVVAIDGQNFALSNGIKPRGGFGSIWYAAPYNEETDVIDKPTHVLKLLQRKHDKDDGDDDFNIITKRRQTSRAEREAACTHIVAGLPKKPAIAHFTKNEKDRTGVLLPLIQGKTLGDILEKPDDIDLPTAVKLALDLVRQLQALHGNNRAHFDTHPSNILVSEDGAHLIDFSNSADFNSPLGASDYATHSGYTIHEIEDDSRTTPLDFKEAMRQDLYCLGLILRDLFSHVLETKDFIAEEMNKVDKESHTGLLAWHIHEMINWFKVDSFSEIRGRGKLSVLSSMLTTLAAAKEANFPMLLADIEPDSEEGLTRDQHTKLLAIRDLFQTANCKAHEICDIDSDDSANEHMSSYYPKSEKQISRKLKNGYSIDTILSTRFMSEQADVIADLHRMDDDEKSLLLEELDGLKANLCLRFNAAGTRDEPSDDTGNSDAPLILASASYPVAAAGAAISPSIIDPLSLFGGVLGSLGTFDPAEAEASRPPGLAGIVEASYPVAAPEADSATKSLANQFGSMTDSFARGLGITPSINRDIQREVARRKKVAPPAPQNAFLLRAPAQKHDLETGEDGKRKRGGNLSPSELNAILPSPAQSPGQG